MRKVLIVYSRYEKSMRVLRILRGIIHEIDENSLDLTQHFGLTRAQLALLTELALLGEVPVKELAAGVMMNPKTVTVIIDQLNSLQLSMVRKRKCPADPGTELVSITEYARRYLNHNSPMPIDELFKRKFENLPEKEQSEIISSLEKLAAILGIENKLLPPLLASGPLTATMKATVDLLAACQFGDT